MKNCTICGKPVRLGAFHITVNRRRGVAHYVAHLDDSPMHEPGWECAMMKPYPANKADTPYQKLIDRWEAQT